MKFSLITADPPYNFSDGLKMSNVKRSAQANYDTLSMQDIIDLPVKEIADPSGALLALWVPSSMIGDGLEIMGAWEFKQKQIYVWVKNKKHLPKDINDLNDCLSFNMGRLFRQTHEVCLIGINNNGIYKKLANKSQRSVSFDENLKHSKKPEHLQNSLELMFPGDNIKKIELFARRERANWVCLGNEVGNKKDIRESLKELI